MACRTSTPRTCYVHPEILTTYVEGSLLLEVKARVEADLRKDLPGLKPEEAAVLTLLQRRLNTTLKDKLAASMKRLSPTKARKAAYVGAAGSAPLLFSFSFGLRYSQALRRGERRSRLDHDAVRSTIGAPAATATGHLDFEASNIDAPQSAP